MSQPAPSKAKSVFEGAGMTSVIEAQLANIRELYRLDEIPWVIGYSGGKDSTAILQLIWMALQGLDPSQRGKPVYVISTDTLVENPIVSRWVANSLQTMERAAQEQGLPILPNKLTPKVQNSFWVNLLGKGYPAPRHKFRWCTERLKIMPSNDFIRSVVQASGEAILVLGTRKAESSKRAGAMKKREEGRVRDQLSPNASLPNCQVYTPIEDWSNDDVWLYLMQVGNPWGHTNSDLLTMYQGATEGGECPLVVDTSTPSCGDSRFGCWVCTMVSQDKSMGAMVQNDVEKEWMLPLLRFRDRLAVKNEEGKWADRSLRDFRRMNGSLTEFHGKLVHGPYKQSVRQEWLEELLRTQTWLRENGPEYVREVELITLEELQEIRRTWVIEKHEIEDELPGIYERAVGVPYPMPGFHETSVIGGKELNLLKDLCEQKLEGEKGVELYGMLRGLLDVEQRFRTMTKRKGLFDALDSVVKFHLFEDEGDAQSFLEEEMERRATADGDLVERELNPTPGPTKGAEVGFTEQSGQLLLPVED
jgi:DNA sulfur modification protein DndC